MSELQLISQCSIKVTDRSSEFRGAEPSWHYYQSAAPRITHRGEIGERKQTTRRHTID